MEQTEPKEGKIPLALLVIGLAIFVLPVFVRSGAEGAAATLLVLGLSLAVGVLLGVIACFITAKILGASFGYLNTAILKLAAVFVFPAAIEALIPIAGLGWLVGFVLYYGLLAWLFDLEVLEVVVLSVVLVIMRFVAFFLVALAFAS